MKLEFCAQTLEKHSNIKIHENRSPAGAELCSVLHGPTDTTKLTVAFRKFAHATKKISCRFKTVHTTLFHVQCNAYDLKCTADYCFRSAKFVSRPCSVVFEI